MKTLLSGCLLLLGTAAAAQNAVRYTIKPGEKVYNVIPGNEIFLYPQFGQGTVVFKDVLPIAAKLNYNSLFGEMQFISPKGDTLTLVNEPAIKHILVAKDTFYYADGCIKLVTNNGITKLAERVSFAEFVQKPGSYELSSEATASNTITALRDGKTVGGEQVEQEVILMKTKVFYIGDRFNEFFKADRRNVLKKFPKHTTAIRNYIDKNKTDFNKTEDLTNLVNFLAGLE